MLTEKTMEKLRILAESAKYDVSCSSSGTVRNPDYTMERLTAIVRDLRTVHRFNGLHQLCRAHANSNIRSSLQETQCCDSLGSQFFI